MKNRHPVILCTGGILLLIIGLASCRTALSPSYSASSSLNRIARRMIEGIDEKTPVAKKSIQVSENNFWERQTRMNLPFSKVLADVLSAELSGRGAVVTLQETGDQPLRLFGSYGLDKDVLTITLLLRRMGAAGGSDIAVVQGRVDRSGLDPKWFDVAFDRITRSLVRQMEDNYRGLDRPVDVVLGPWTPRLSGRPILLLGQEFEKYMENALSASPVFRPVKSCAGRDLPELTGSYDLVGETVNLGVKISRNNAILTTATFSASKNDIPQSLLAPGIRSLKDAADIIAQHLAADCRNRGIPGRGQPPWTVFVNKNYINDTSDRTNYPLSIRLADAFRGALSDTGVFKVTEDPACPSGLFLCSSYHREGDRLIISAQIKCTGTDSSNAHTAPASASAVLHRRYWADDWFEPTIRGKMDFLMYSLEQKCTASPRMGHACTLMVESFTYEQTRLYSPFSKYISRYALDYFSGSRLFTPVTDVQQRLKTVQQERSRGIVPNKIPGSAVAELANATHMIRGSYWRISKNMLEVRAEMSDIHGKVIASDRTRIAKNLVNPDLLHLPQSDDSAFMNDLGVLAPDADTPLSVELFTQKGRNNLSYAVGESVVFYVKTNQAVYVRIFNRDPDGKVYRIYPNRFDRGLSPVPAHSVTAIPNITYNPDFEFSVQGDTGNELAFAYASDRPLPELPGADVGQDGMRQISLSVKQIHQKYVEYAARHGIKLSRDVIAIRTTP